MITIKIDGVALDTFPNTKIQLNLSNPLFSENFINEGYSYSFNLPRTPKNRTFLIGEKNKVEVFFKGVLLMKAVLISYNNNHESFIINIVTMAKSFKDEIESIMLSDLQLPIIPICEESDSSISKVSKWLDHMVAIANEDANEGMYKFPAIDSVGYTNFYETEETPEEINLIFETSGRRINRGYISGYAFGFGVPDTYTRKSFVQTVAPCVKVKYLVELVLKKFKLKIRTNELDQIEEYLQLCIFNNYVLDKIETSGGFIYNTHGLEIDLKKHVPNNTVLDLFQTLNERFDAYFVIEGNVIDIFVSKNKLKSNAENVSKYASESYAFEPQEFAGVNFSEALEDGPSLKHYRTLESFDLISGENQWIYPNEVKNYPNSKPTNSENQFISEAMTTSIAADTIGVPNNFAEWENLSTTLPQLDIPGWGFQRSAAFTPFYLKSDEYPDNGAEIFEKIKLICYRGKYASFLPGFDSPSGEPNVSLNTTPLHNFVFNFKRAFIINEDSNPDIDIKHIFGKSSIYINGPDNCIDYYKKPKLQILYKSSINTKLLYLPLFKVQELMQWNKNRHAIQQKKQSFNGWVKNINFAVENDKLSATEIEYIVKFDGLKGEFNDDFNNDFLTD
jgi:hypothetical protein